MVSPRYLVLAVVPLFYGSSGAAEDVAAPPPDAVFAPLPRSSYLRFEPSYTFLEEGGSASELHVRAVVGQRWSVPAPGSVQRLWALGADLALRHECTSTFRATGIGDLELTPLAGLSAHVGVVGVGLALAVPTATSDVLGTRAVRLGPAWFAQTSALPHVELAVLVRSYAAVAATRIGPHRSRPRWNPPWS